MAIAIATPFAIVFSLVGGLLGPHFVVLYALVPYLLLVGLPVLPGRGCAWGEASRIAVADPSGSERALIGINPPRLRFMAFRHFPILIRQDRDRHCQRKVAGV